MRTKKSKVRKGSVQEGPIAESNESLLRRFMNTAYELGRLRKECHIRLNVAGDEDTHGLVEYYHNRGTALSPPMSPDGEAEKYRMGAEKNLLKRLDKEFPQGRKGVGRGK